MNEVGHAEKQEIGRRANRQMVVRQAAALNEHTPLGTTSSHHTDRSATLSGQTSDTSEIRLDQSDDGPIWGVYRRAFLSTIMISGWLSSPDAVVQPNIRPYGYVEISSGGSIPAIDCT